MNSLEEMIMEEISTLPDMRLIDVLGFIRFLKSEKTEKPQWIEEWFESALKSVHARDAEFKITQSDIEDQIQKMREKKK